MSDISNLLTSILSAVYGRDVRQSIHDAIKACYTDVSNSKTLSEAASANANAAAESAVEETDAAISTMKTEVGRAVADCISATTAANTAAAETSRKASIANAAADAANTAKEECNSAANALPGQIQKAMSEVGFVVEHGKICVKVERDD